MDVGSQLSVLLRSSLSLSSNIFLLVSRLFAYQFNPVIRRLKAIVEFCHEKNDALYPSDYERTSPKTGK